MPYLNELLPMNKFIYNDKIWNAALISNIFLSVALLFFVSFFGVYTKTSIGFSLLIGIWPFGCMFPLIYFYYHTKHIGSENVHYNTPLDIYKNNAVYTVAHSALGFLSLFEYLEYSVILACCLSYTIGFFPALYLTFMKKSQPGRVRSPFRRNAP